MSLSLSPTLSTKDLFLNACEYGDLELVRVLLARGADVNWRREKGTLSTGLHYAAKGGHGDLVDLLLAQPGVAVNIKNRKKSTPLMVACWNGNENIARKLIQVEGIDINCQDNTGWTALHFAAQEDFPGCIQLLREVPGLEWNLKDEDGETPLLKAAAWGNAGSLESILSVPQPQLDLTVTDDEGYNVAWRAVLNRGEEEEAEEDEELDEGDGDRQTCVKLLCGDPRVDWNHRDPEDGETPLLSCLEEGEVELAKMIIKNPRVDLNVQNNDAEFPETIAR